MKTTILSLKKHWNKATTYVRPCMKTATKTVTGIWIASSIITFIVLWIDVGNLHFLLTEQVGLSLLKFLLMLVMVSGLMLTAMRIGLTSLLVLWFWLSTLTAFAPTAQAAPQLSFAYAGAANYEQHWEPTAPTNRFEFSQTAPTETYAPTIPFKEDEICYEATVNENNLFIVNMTIATKTFEKKIVVERMRKISDLTRYTTTHAPLTSEGMAVLLHNIARIYEGDFQRNDKSNCTTKSVKIAQLELMTYAGHVQQLTGISRSRAVAFIDNSFYCQLKNYDSYKKIGNYAGEHNYFKKTETIPDRINKKQA